MKRIFILIQISILFSCQNNEQLNEKSVIESINLKAIDSTNANFEDSILKEKDSTSNLEEEEPNLNNKTPIYPVNVLEALEMKDNAFGVDYLPGELKPWDSIVDVKYGYYELFKKPEENFEKYIVKQAKVFKNTDSSTTLFLNCCECDMQTCFHKISFYEISKDSIHPILKEKMLPKLKIKDFIKDTNSVINIIEKYYAQFHEILYYNSVDEIIGDLFQKTYFLSEKGESLIATPEYNDYPRMELGTYGVQLKDEEWSTIFSNLNDIELEYDPLNKKFIRK